MEHFEKMLKRTDVRQICSFILNGMDDSETCMKSYEQRIKEQQQALIEKIQHILPDEQERDDFLSEMFQAFVIREQIYTEIGIKAGAKIMFNLLAGNGE